jgi:predicted dehydrogenase
MIKFGVVGIQHPHATAIVAELLAAGAHCTGYVTQAPGPEFDSFQRRFPNLPGVDDPRRLIEDSSTTLIVSADVPDQRAGIATIAMRAGKDVIVAKPGCTSLDQLRDIRKTVRETGRRWIVVFSERLHVRAAVRAEQLLRSGAIGDVVQTIGLGPHRLTPSARPAWFFDPARAGGILADLASHQIDQFLAFTGSASAEIVSSTVANYGMPDHPGFETFGEVLLRSAHAHGYARVDWHTPDGLPTWGDGRMIILGTAGCIELRKYIDIAGRPGGDHLFLVDHHGTRHLDCSDVRLPFYPAVLQDLLHRTETAMGQEHTLITSELAVTANERAVRAGNLEQRS